ncbi:UNVERIFIED_CONTAM: hypothetical protein NCL1_52567 [Trichonephila clavipes]
MACEAEDYGFQMLNYDEIVTSVQKESGPVDDETDENEEKNNNESSKGPSKADAFSALETTMEWYEQQSECYPTQLLLLKRIRDLETKKRRCTMVYDYVRNRDFKKAHKWSYHQLKFQCKNKRVDGENNATPTLSGHSRGLQSFMILLSRTISY